MISPHFSTLAEVEWPFEDGDVNWDYCNINATFSHRDACEFIIHAGDADFTENKAKEMKRLGCTDEFISAYKLAAASGAIRVLFWT